MTRLFEPAVPIAIETDSAGRPVSFTLHRRKQRLAQVIQHWEVDADWWRSEGAVHREYWAVTTLEGLLCVIYRDTQGPGDTWFLVKIYD